MKRAHLIIILSYLASLNVYAYEWALQGVPTALYVNSGIARGAEGGFHDGVAVVQDVDNRDNKLCGVINTAGELIVPYKYEFISDFVNGFAIVRNDGAYGIINTTGSFVLPLNYTDISPANDRKELYIVKDKDGKTGLFYDGNMVLPMNEYTNIELRHFPFISYTVNGNSRTYNIMSGKSFSSILKIGDVIISDNKYYEEDGTPIDMEKNAISSKGVTFYEENSRYGFKEAASGRIITAPKYKSLDYHIWINDIMIAKPIGDEGAVIITADGYEKPFETDVKIDVVIMYNFGIMVAWDKDMNCGMFDSTGKCILENKHMYINEEPSLGKGWFVCNDFDNSFIYNANTKNSFVGTILSDEDVSENIVKLYDSDKQMDYYIDLSTMKQIGKYYNSGEPFSEGLARVNDKIFIDRKGKTVLDLSKFHSVGKRFSEGVIPVDYWDPGNQRITGYIYNPLTRSNYAYNQKGATKSMVNRWLIEADELYRNKKYGRAKELYYRAMVNDPNNFNLVCNYGYCLYELGYKEEAKAAYEIAADIDPDAELPKKNLAIIEESIKKDQELASQPQPDNSSTSNNFWDALNNFTNIFVQTLGNQSANISGDSSWNESSAASGNMSSSSGADSSSYLSMYRRWENNAESNYNSLTLLGSDYKSKSGDRSGSNGASYKGSTYVGLKQNLRNAQRQMKHIRAEAASKGVKIPQSKWETAQVKY